MNLARPLFAACALVLASAAPGFAQDLKVTEERVPDQVIVRIEHAQFEELAFIEHQIGALGHQRLFEHDLWLLYLPEGSDVVATAQLVARLPNVTYACPNAVVRAIGVPNDPNFSSQWGFKQGNDADIDAPEAWDLLTDASSVVVAVIDTGAQWDHTDLSGNIWTNVNEIPGNGVDDDGNGYIDDIHGYDFVNHDGNPMDDNGHGTHTSGTVGAVTNNSKGVAGVCWKARIMPLKFLNSGGSGAISDSVLAVEYSMNNGANLSSNSWGCYCSTDSMQPLADAIEAAWTNKGMLFVAAAGNAASDNDSNPFYPASLTMPEVFAVAASDQNDNLAGFSNYGRTSVDIAAPGNDIYSTWPTNTYTYLSGTSMACPHVAGAVALASAYCPDRNLIGIKGKIMASVDKPAAFNGKCVSNGRLNLRGALEACPCKVSYKASGSGLAGSGGFIPQLTGTDGSCNAGGHSLNFTNGLGGAAGALWIGTKKADIPFYGGHFYIDFSAPWPLIFITLQGTPGVAGAGFLDISGADVSAFSGLFLYLQGSFSDPGAVLGVSLTPSLKMTID
ncbi:MAG: S8 family peptidase [Planctomycetota bacterium]